MCVRFCKVWLHFLFGTFVKKRFYIKVSKCAIMIALVKLVASETDSLGYITYVFKHLEDNAESSKYTMCVRYPNWDAKKLKLGDIGFLHYEEIRAGIDQWYDGKQMVTYNYNTVQFIKFVYKPEDEECKYTL